jgi:hypothetical protein
MRSGVRVGHGNVFQPLRGFFSSIAQTFFAFLVLNLDSGAKTVGFLRQRGFSCDNPPCAISLHAISKERWKIMKITLVSVLSMVFLLVLGAPAQILESITPAQLEAIFKEEGYSYTVDPEGDIRWKIEGTKTQVLITWQGTALTFGVVFKGSKATLEKVNKWNRTKSFSRSYMDEEGDPVLEVDLAFRGGITKARIVDFLGTCKSSLAAWHKEVLD